MREKTNISNIPILNCLANYITNGWALSHKCVGKTKGPPQYFCHISVFFYWFGTGGAGTCAANGGVSEDPASDFCARFGRTTSVLSKGGGGGRALPPPSRLQSPPKAPITCAQTHQFSIVQYWPRFPSYAPPTRASRPPPTFFCSVISKCLFEVHYQVHCWPRTLIFSIQCPLSVQSVCLEFSTHWWPINHNPLHVYTLLIKGPPHQQQRKDTYSNIKIPVNVVHPHTHRLRFKGLLELF
jgi:hypothetical protein